MFANVVRARVLQDAEINKEVAIKIIRSQESMSVHFLRMILPRTLKQH
jgi:hypothetical protein